MKHARKMVLVDINTVKQATSHRPDGNLSTAINSLVTATEFSKANYGPNAKTIATLDSELKSIIDDPNISPTNKIHLYNQGLQKYLFFLHGSEKAQSNELNASDTTAVEEPEGEVYLPNTPHQPVPRGTSSSSPSPGTSSSEYFDTPKAVKKPPQQTPIKRKRIFKSNIPRTTPVGDRLRQPHQRAKNNRFKDYFLEWKSHDSSS